MSESPVGLPAKKPRSVIWKMLTMIGLILILLIPMGMVSGIIEERQRSQDEVVWDIANTWAGEQVLIGPILAIPYKTVIEIRGENNKKHYKTVEEIAYLLPQQYDVTGTLKPEVRYRGIYQSTVYTSQLKASGSFDLKSLSELPVSKDQFLWNKAFLVLGIPHTKGINQRPALSFRGKSLELLPGVNGTAFLSGGLYTPLPLTPNQSTSPFKLDLSLNGSESLSIAPIGKQNALKLTSSWKTPSFIGNTLPSQKPQVDENGFKASWNIPYFARNYGQAFIQKNEIQQRIASSSVGVELLTSVDCYRESERATKYAVLFFVLTFATYFLFEVVTRQRLHPFQYLLIGAALCLFYLLLISISEIIQFVWAYAIASIATIAVISLYSSVILRQAHTHAAGMIAGLLSILYGYLYILLQLEDYSLLFGSIGLFIVLAILMYVTRNIDWYNEQVA